MNGRLLLSPNNSLLPKHDADKTIPPLRRSRWNADFNRGRGPGSTASGTPHATPPEVRPPPRTIVFF